MQTRSVWLNSIAGQEWVAEQHRHMSESVSSIAGQGWVAEQHCRPRVSGWAALQAKSEWLSSIAGHEWVAAQHCRPGVCGWAALQARSEARSELLSYKIMYLIWLNYILSLQCLKTMKEKSYIEKYFLKIPNFLHSLVQKNTHCASAV